MKILLKDKNGVILHTEKQYCTEDIQVAVSTDELNIIPTSEEQVKEGLFSKVTVAGVEVTETGGAKVFRTVEEMQADTTTTEEGELAIVYKNEKENLKVNTEFQVATFPEIVTLPTAVDDYIDLGGFSSSDGSMFDCMGYLDSGYFSMECYTETGMIRIEYSSNDGVTYTRSTLMGDNVNGNELDFGTVISFDSSSMWNDLIGYFFLIQNKTFSGLYESVSAKDTTKSSTYTLGEGLNAKNFKIFTYTYADSIPFTTLSTIYNLVANKLAEKGLSLKGLLIHIRNNNEYDAYVYHDATKTDCYNPHFYQDTTIQDDSIYLGKATTSGTLEFYGFSININDNTIIEKTVEIKGNKVDRVGNIFYYTNITVPMGDTFVGIGTTSTSLGGLDGSVRILTPNTTTGETSVVTSAVNCEYGIGYNYQLVSN